MMLLGKRAVICEDEGLTVMHLRRILTRAGMTIVGEAASGEQAVTVTLQERPDMVLMDIDLPDRSGLEAAREILAAYPVCIVILSGFSDAEHRQQAHDLAVCAYITKPVGGSAFVRQLEEAYTGFTVDAGSA